MAAWTGALIGRIKLKGRGKRCRVPKTYTHSSFKFWVESIFKRNKNIWK